jgi:hypothetical protein
MALQLKTSQYAAEQIKQTRANAEARPNSAHDAKWRALKKLLQEIVSNEDHALSAATALGRRGSLNLAGIRRAKLGRERIFFVASREKQVAIVLMLGYRKEGDRNDAYVEIVRHIRRGEFDEQFREAGIAKPDV